MVSSIGQTKSPGDVARTVSFVVDPETLRPGLRVIKEYWDAKRGLRAMPARTDVDPWELRAYLPRLFMIDVLPDAADFRFRLLGTEITERYGRDSTGRTLREMYAVRNPQVLETILRMYAALLKVRRPILASGTLSVIGKDFISYESLHLPLSDDGERVNIILGAVRFSTHGDRASNLIDLGE
jgi:hypothetical protein